ncbi:MAG: hypothetical protein IKX53_02985 [Bacteroidales bacterium]|nr:hypothetical protein [Bacteroidales bacterium]
MNEFALSLLLLGALSTGNQLPFWMSANQFGLMPEGSGSLALVKAGTQYDTSKDFQWNWGVSLAGNTEGTADFNLMVDELYASAKWKAFRLDAGMKHVDIDFYGAGMSTLGSMSTTGGHVAWSGNARTMPGYLITMDPVPVPFTRKIMWVRGAFGDFKTLDNRYVKGALVHRQQLFFLFKILPQLDFQFGLDHSALWAGTSPQYGKMPITLDNYLRVITARHASSAGTASDQKNVIGDQRGGTLYRLDWRGETWKLCLQRDIPYDDGSGIGGIQNHPDGVYTFWFGFDDKDRWVSDILFEYQYTMKQSGTYHDRKRTPEELAKLEPSDSWDYYNKIYGGCDNYFNNGYYKSGWTYYGRTIGDPLIVPQGTHTGTWTGKETVLGVESNRLKAHHLSIAGKLFKKMPYKLMLTYSRNYGTYSKQYLGESQWKKPWGTVQETPLRQVYGAFVGEVPFRHVSLTYGLYADRGQLLQDCFGATLGIRYDFKAK